MRYLILAILVLAVLPGTALAAEEGNAFGETFANDTHPGFGADPVLDAEALANIEPAAGDDMEQGPGEDWIRDLNRAAREMMGETVSEQTVPAGDTVPNIQ